MKKSLLALVVIAAFAMVGCNHKPVVPDDMFCITALEDGMDVSMKIYYPEKPFTDVGFVYSTDGKKWEDFIVGQTTVTLPKAGDKMYVKASTPTSTLVTVFEDQSLNSHNFVFSRKAKVSGNVMYLLNGEHPNDVQMKIYALSSLFYGTENLVDASELLLPANQLTSFCYAGMFYQCTSLLEAPKLPATKLADNCYAYMFYGCTQLKKAPALPATEMETLCYLCMFFNCSALQSAPALPATQLKEECYYGMFLNCSSLQQAPVLPATQLVESCYRRMFENCTSLTDVTCLATDMSAADCLLYWMDGITTNGTLHAVPGTDWTGKIPDTWTVAYR